MNRKQTKLIFQSVSGVLACLSLLGCHLIPPKKTDRSAITQIQSTLTESITQNKKNGLNQDIPESVQAALLPKREKKTKIIADNKNQFDLSCEKVPVKQFFLSLVEGTNHNVIVHPEVEGEISLSLKNVTLKDVLEAVRNAYGFEYEFSPQGIYVLAPKLQTRSFKVDYLNVNRSGTSGTKVHSGGLGGSSTEDEDSSTDPSNLHSQITTTSTTDFWNELKTAIQLIVGESEDRKVAVSPLAGIVVVQAMPSDLQRVEAFLAQAQGALNKQVILEAKVLEVELNEGFQAGINWGLLNGQIKAAQIGSGVIGASENVPDIPSTSLSATSAIDIGPSGGNIQDAFSSAGSTANIFGGVFSLAVNFKRFSTFMELLEAQGKVHVLSSPRVSTLNNQKALIKVGDEKFFVTNIEAPQVVTSGGIGTANTLPDITFETFFSGIALDVTPQISPDNFVTLHVHPTISDVTEDSKSVQFGTGTSASAQVFPLAASTVRETDSVVRAQSGQIVVIGGLMQDRKKEVIAGVPILRSLPIIGKWFEHKRYKTQKSELVILLKPQVINGTTWTADLEDSLDRIQRIGGQQVPNARSIDRYFSQFDSKSLYTK